MVPFRDGLTCPSGLFFRSCCVLDGKMCFGGGGGKEDTGRVSIRDSLEGPSIYG